MKDNEFTLGKMCQQAEFCMAENECMLKELIKRALATKNHELLARALETPPCGNTEESTERELATIYFRPN